MNCSILNKTVLMALLYVIDFSKQQTTSKNIFAYE